MNRSKIINSIGDAAIHLNLIPRSSYVYPDVMCDSVIRRLGDEIAQYLKSKEVI
jgi:hypothetical protein